MFLKSKKTKLSFSTGFHIISSNFLATFTKYFIVINFTVQVFSVITSTPVSRIVPTNSSTKSAKSGGTGKLIQGDSGRPDLAAVLGAPEIFQLLEIIMLFGSFI